MRGWFLAAVLAAVALAVVGILLTRDVEVEKEKAKAQAACRVISPGEDLDAIINADSGSTATTFCLQAGTYNVDKPAILKSGDKLLGVEGSTVTRGPATYPASLASKIVAVNGSDRVLSMVGSNIEVAWVDVSGAQGRIDQSANNANCPSSNITVGCPVVGEGVGITMGAADGTASVHHVRVHDNDAVGISNAAGRIKNSELFGNTQMSAYLNVNGSSIKGIREYEAAYNYVHDEQGMGIWFDHSLSTEGNVPQMAQNPGDAAGDGWVHHNLVVNNHQYGMRHEYAPRDAGEGQHFSTPSFLWEENRVAGTATNAGMSIRDAQNSEVRNNHFGPQTISGVSYGNNVNKTAVVASDSGRADRTDLWNVNIHDNILNGEVVKGCELPDNVVVCSNNGGNSTPPDADGDGVPDAEDNCPSVANSGQADLDGDGAGDACDSQDNRDSDGDGVQNWEDNCDSEPGPASNGGCPLPQPTCSDPDGDGIPNSSDPDSDGDGIPNSSDPDRDNDGVPNGRDSAPKNPCVQ